MDGDADSDLTDGLSEASRLWLARIEQASRETGDVWDYDWSRVHWNRPGTTRPLHPELLPEEWENHQGYMQQVDARGAALAPKDERQLAGWQVECSCTFWDDASRPVWTIELHEPVDRWWPPLEVVAEAKECWSREHMDDGVAADLRRIQSDRI